MILAWVLLGCALALWPAPSPARLRWRALARSRWAGAARIQRRLDRRREVDDAGALRVVRALRAELAAGARPVEAMSATARGEPDFATVLHAAGRAAAGARDVAAELAREPSLRGLSAAWRLVDVAGAPLADVLSGVADDLRRRIEQRQAVTAALAGPQAAALLLAGLPLLGLLLAAGMGARPLEFLTGTQTGHVVAGLGVLLDLAGVAWTRRLARSAQRE